MDNTGSNANARRRFSWWRLVLADCLHTYASMVLRNYLKRSTSADIPLSLISFQMIKVACLTRISCRGLRASLLIASSNFRCTVCTPAGTFLNGRVGLNTDFRAFARARTCRNRYTIDERQQSKLLCTTLYVECFTHTTKPSLARAIGIVGTLVITLFGETIRSF